MKNHWVIMLAGITLLIVLAVVPRSSHAQAPSEQVTVILEIPDGAKAGPDFDVDEATEAYINLLSE